MPSIYKVKVGKQGRIVLPKQLRKAYEVNTGDEAIIIAQGQELRIHFHKNVEDPLQDITELSESISIGLSSEKLKKKTDDERLKHFHKT